MKRLATPRAAPDDYDSNASKKLPRNKKARNGELPECRENDKKPPYHKGSHNYCVLCEKARINECNYKLHSSEILF